MNILRQIFHPNIIEFYGYTESLKDSKNKRNSFEPNMDSQDRKTCFYLVMEYAPNGTLHNLIHNPQEASKPLDLTKIMKYLIQIARALVYLHNYTKSMIFIRDLNSNNIVIDAENNIKLIDFGFSKILSKQWTAPEQFESAATITTEKSDIYSFGVIIWELFTRKLPFSEAKNDMQIAARKKDKNTFEFPPNTPMILISLAKQCFNDNPASRPTAIKILWELDRYFSNLPADNIDERSKINTPPPITGSVKSLASRFEPSKSNVGWN